MIGSLDCVFLALFVCIIIPCGKCDRLYRTVDTKVNILYVWRRVQLFVLGF